MSRHRFQPRFRSLAALAIVAGLGLAAVSLLGALGEGGVVSGAVIGLVGVAFGGAYLLSPTWKLAVVATDDELRVEREGRARFQLPWSEIREVIASPGTRTCFVDGGSPERSLLVPGPGAPASYRLEDAGHLYEQIVSRVGSDLLKEVDTLDRHAARSESPS